MPKLIEKLSENTMVTLGTAVAVGWVAMQAVVWCAGLKSESSANTKTIATHEQRLTQHDELLRDIAINQARTAAILERLERRQ
jgi:hypothetical protein